MCKQVSVCLGVGRTFLFSNQSWSGDTQDFALMLIHSTRLTRPGKSARDLDQTTTPGKSEWGKAGRQASRPPALPLASSFLGLYSSKLSKTRTGVTSSSSIPQRLYLRSAGGFSSRRRCSTSCSWLSSTTTRRPPGSTATPPKLVPRGRRGLKSRDR